MRRPLPRRRVWPGAVVLGCWSEVDRCTMAGEDRVRRYRLAVLFISHSSADQLAVERLRDRLREWGYGSMFLDFDPEHGIALGRAWEQELYAQLSAADAVVFVASRASVSSRWCFAELALARSARKPIFPVAIEAGVRMSLLEDRQWLELDGEAADSRLERALRDRFHPRDALSWDASRPP